jgi:hypothetical protein
MKCQKLKVLVRIRKKTFCKSAQVTIFIIIGLVLLIIAIALISLAGWLSTPSINNNGAQITPTELEPIINYLETCVETITKEGLLLIGSQGGVIYQKQGGRTIDFDDSEEGNLFMEYPDDKTRVVYRIDAPTGAGVICMPTPPDYPLKYGTYPYKQKPDGTPNLIAPKEYQKPGCFGMPIYTSPKSMVRDLKSYIESNIDNRCGLSSFSNYGFKTSKPTVAINSNYAKTSIKVDYPTPITITNKNSGARSTFDQFSGSIPFGLRDVIDFVDVVMQSDTDDPTHNIKVRSPTYSKFKITVVPDVYKRDDIIKVRSDSISVHGEPFEFIFARKNRIPILEHLYDVSVDSVSFTKDYIIKWSDVIRQPLVAVDPDEDNVTINVYLDELKTREWIPGTEYKITGGDIAKGYIPVIIQASDGELIDWKTYEIK